MRSRGPPLLTASRERFDVNVVDTVRVHELNPSRRVLRDGGLQRSPRRFEDCLQILAEHAVPGDFVTWL